MGAPGKLASQQILKDLDPSRFGNPVFQSPPADA
jgi:hypothetical protein